MKKLSLWSAAALVLPVLFGLSSRASAQDPACQVRYPIVLSHHWGARPICPDGRSDVCDSREPARYCENWEWDVTELGYDCTSWRVPANELDLPPRNVNAVDPTLTRDASTYHRYFSRAIVDQIGASCGNQVYISDKPVLASYERRARSLRETVLQALRETGASKVILIGMSQGAQDARYMTASLPVDDDDASAGRMRDRVAAVVTLSGEDDGADSASILLETIYAATVLTGGSWGDSQGPAMALGTTDSLPWLTPQGERVLMEGYDVDDPSEYDLDDAAMGRNFLHSLAQLSPKYMRGYDLPGRLWATDWDGLRAFLGMEESWWGDRVFEDDEIDNGVEYFSYAAQIRNWDGLNWGLDTDFAAFSVMSLSSGLNDGYVSVSSQNLGENDYPNFHHIRTLDGCWLGRGYHHMFWSGRNDAIYQPGPSCREAAPYSGSSASVYRQILIDLRARNF